MTRTVTDKIIAALALGAALVIPACAAEDKAEVSEDFSDLAGLDDKSDAFSYRMKIVGSLTYGSKSEPVVYTAFPRFRAFKFAGDAGDKVVVDVISTSGAGDAVAWILNDEFEVVGFNDDSETSDTLDARIELTLPELPTYEDGTPRRTHYIVFRDYWLRRRTFVVNLEGTPATTFKTCQKDADCIKITDGCCNISWLAINKDQEAEYLASLGCEANPICPAVVLRNTDDVAQCDTATNECVLVDPHAMRCGGHTINPHFCPDDYLCYGKQQAWDAPGQCVKQCGGFGGVACAEGFHCVDNDMDDCDPNAGGADCPAVCLPATCGGFGNLSCPAGLECIEDPHDDCDVASGGADCGSICVFP